MGEGRRPGGDQDATDQTTGRRLTVPEAAEALGVTADAVRSRIKRGTLPTVREAGRVFVIVAGGDRPTAPAQPTNRPGEERLYQEMQDRIAYLERQVDEEREARRRADTLLARLMDRVPELEPPAESPPDERASPEPVDEQQGRGPPRSDTSGAQEGARRSWWRRVLGR